MKLISWNVNGLRACVGKDFEQQFKVFNADFFCLQETKMQAGQLDLSFPGYESYLNYSDKKGVHNSFNSPDSINHLDWNNLTAYPQVFQYYSRLIRLRKNHPAFRLGNADLVRKHLEFLPVQDCLVAFRLKDHAGGDKWNNIYVILNANSSLRTVNIPKGNYTIVCANGDINEAGLGQMEGGEVMVDAQSALILHD